MSATAISARSKTQGRRYSGWIGVCSLLISLTFYPLTANADEDDETITGAQPIASQPSKSDIEPGLSVTYYYAMFEDVAYISKLVKGKPGQPIAMLDHDTDTGKVLTSKRSMGVGAEIRGMIQFPEAGTYILRINSNDGVKLSIAGILVYEDPYIHSDIMSDPINFVVEKAGWYDLEIDYYQKKGTSALGLYWTPPQGDTEVAVPAKFYGHLK
ncbi:PA14 domain-containing protein [Motiliproteus sp. MSK22-1]|uniref:PA14 domain-containing protein n=1 Tax=Motiliproteus sp. MSK22-1 TaxID=1897630 RepID=UPI00097819A3|nr:PA14 domain-containing protein [Motiliproteus sp. MSK22-1]OMH25786.1 hypothetical protein BGP75_25005 [Motiliproteus sp. MSK22-1]